MSETAKILRADTRVVPDVRDDAILATRLAAYDQIAGPRLGDWVEFSDGVMHRFSHLWNSNLQTTEKSRGSFYFGNGYVEFSGGLNPGIPRDTLVDCNKTMLGRIWFFHHSEAKAYNAVYAEVPFRVFSTPLTSNHWKKDPPEVDKEL